MSLTQEEPGVNLKGKVVIVTGGDTGIGYEVVKGLAEMGAHTIMASRSKEKATNAIEQMKQTTSTTLNIEYIPLDLTSFQKVSEFAAQFKERKLSLHILINCEAVAWIAFSITVDGYEKQYQVNHISPTFLVLELLSVLASTAKVSGDCRILFVSSHTHHHQFTGDLNFDNLNSQLDYDRLRTYPRTKLYNIMTAYALQRRLKNMNISISAQEAVSELDECDDNLQDKELMEFINKIKNTSEPMSMEESVRTILTCATGLISQHKLYYGIAGKPTTPSQDALNVQYQEELWKQTIAAIKDHLSAEALKTYQTYLTPTSTVQYSVYEEYSVGSDTDPTYHLSLGHGRAELRRFRALQGSDRGQLGVHDEHHEITESNNQVCEDIGGGNCAKNDNNSTGSADNISIEIAENTELGPCTTGANVGNSSIGDSIKHDFIAGGDGSGNGSGCGIVSGMRFGGDGDGSSAGGVLGDLIPGAGGEDSSVMIGSSDNGLSGIVSNLPTSTAGHDTTGGHGMSDDMSSFIHNITSEWAAKRSDGGPDSNVLDNLTGVGGGGGQSTGTGDVDNGCEDCGECNCVCGDCGSCGGCDCGGGGCDCGDCGGCNCDCGDCGGCDCGDCGGCDCGDCGDCDCGDCDCGDDCVIS